MRRGFTTVKALVCVSLGSLIVFFLSFFFVPNHEESATGDNQNELRDLKLRMDAMQESLTQALARVEELSCLLRKNGTRGGFCLTNETMELGGYISWDWKLAIQLEGLLAEQSVVEFGAGLGWYGRFFLRHSHSLFKGSNETEIRQFFGNKELMKLMKIPQLVYSWKGYDGATFVEDFTGGLVQFLDLSHPFWLPEKYDWVLSFDTGDRIPARLEDNFIDNLVRHACKGIVLSWGIPGQTLHYHVNERSNGHVTDKMSERGFVPDFAWEDQLHENTFLSWTKYSLMVFRPVKEITDEACKLPKNQSRIHWETFLKKVDEEHWEQNETENTTTFLDY